VIMKEAFKTNETDAIENQLPINYYTDCQGENERLFTTPNGIMERLRTNAILERFTPPPPAVVYDIGGGAGVHAFPLAQQGYRVHLIDLTPFHVEQAAAHMQESGVELAECAVGDARDIPAPDEVADVVLLLGPLYHLKEKADRLKAIREAWRILKPGGILFAVGISRFAVYFDFGALNQLHDPHIAALSEDVTKTGQNHQPQEGSRDFFSYSAYFHHPDELEQEVEEAGFADVQMLSVEGPSWLFAGLKDTVQDEQALQTALCFVEMVESERSVMGAGGHIMAVGRK